MRRPRKLPKNRTVKRLLYKSFKFDLDKMDDDRVQSKFRQASTTYTKPPTYCLYRFLKYEIKQLIELLGLYLVVYRYRYRVNPVTALCVVLYRLTFSTRLCSIEEEFG